MREVDRNPMRRHRRRPDSRRPKNGGSQDESTAMRDPFVLPLVRPIRPRRLRRVPLRRHRLPMTTDLRLADVTDLLDGLSAFEQFSRLNKLYLAQLREREGPLLADERQALLDLGRRSLNLIEPADLFLQSCQEHAQQAKGDELNRRLQELLASGRLSTPVKGR